MKLLVGYDGSNTAKAALELAFSHAKAFDAALEIVTSMERGTENETGKIAQAKDRLDHAEKFAAENGVTAGTHLLIRGLKPGEDVVKFAEENGVDGIFIGLKRRSKVGKLLFGSNAQFIILKSPCPVMSVR